MNSSHRSFQPKKQSNLKQSDKSNVTLWKNRNYSSDAPPNQNITQSVQSINNRGGKRPVNEPKHVEGEFIENLKKQIYFMEMELRLMKEREKEIEKTKGFSQLFNDDRDPSQHIVQLKGKYANMRKDMENKLEILNNKKREVTGLNVSLRARLDTLKKLEKEMEDKVINLENSSNEEIMNITMQYEARHKEREDLEQYNKEQKEKIKNELNNNNNLEYKIRSNKKQNELDKEQFESTIEMINEMTNQKNKKYEETLSKIKEIEDKTNEDTFYQKEVEKNKKFKKEIEDNEKKILQVNTNVEEIEVMNNFLIEKKQKIIDERRKLNDFNIELKHEIEAKNQINEVRIQKKLKEANCPEIQKLNEDLREINSKIDELNQKINKEVEKIKTFTDNINRYEIEKETQEKKQNELQEIGSKLEESVENLRAEHEKLQRENEELMEQIGEAKNDNENLRKNNKILAEEYYSINSRYEYIVKNYDYTSNLKKISMEDLKDLAETNSLVNNAINGFVNKLETFKEDSMMYNLK